MREIYVSFVSASQLTGKTAVSPDETFHKVVSCYKQGHQWHIPQPGAQESEVKARSESASGRLRPVAMSSWSPINDVLVRPREVCHQQKSRLEQAGREPHVLIRDTLLCSHCSTWCYLRRRVALKFKLESCLSSRVSRLDAVALGSLPSCRAPATAQRTHDTPLGHFVERSDTRCQDPSSASPEILLPNGQSDHVAC